MLYACDRLDCSPEPSFRSPPPAHPLRTSHDFQDPAPSTGAPNTLLDLFPVTGKTIRRRLYFFDGAARKPPRCEVEVYIGSQNAPSRAFFEPDRFSSTRSRRHHRPPETADRHPPSWKKTGTRIRIAVFLICPTSPPNKLPSTPFDYNRQAVDGFFFIHSPKLDTIEENPKPTKADPKYKSAIHFANAWKRHGPHGSHTTDPQPIHLKTLLWSSAFSRAVCVGRGIWYRSTPPSRPFSGSP